MTKFTKMPKIRVALLLLDLVLFALSTASPFLNRNIEARKGIPGTPCSVIKPTPKFSVCGKAGHVHGAANLEVPQEYGSMEQCLNKCTKHTYIKGRYSPSGCIAFSYNEVDKHCHLFFLNVTTMDFQPQPMSAQKFWDYSCFDCPSPCSHQPYYQTLLDNGGFEKPLFGFWEDYGYGRSVVSPGYKSEYMYQCALGICDLTQTFESCKGHYYRITADYKIDNKTTDGQHVSEISLATHEFDKLLPATGQWEILNHTFEAEYKGLNVLRFENNIPYTNISIDNVKVFRIP